MKTLLQNCKTGKYMRIDSLWTGDINLAMDFLSVLRAVSYGIKEVKDSFNIIQNDTADHPAGPQITSVSMENLVPNLAGVTRYSISAGIIESSVQSAHGHWDLVSVADDYRETKTAPLRVG